MKKSNKNDKKSIAIVIFGVLAFLMIVLAGIKSRQADRCDHYVACADTCFPHKVDKERSKVYCHCLENEDETN